MFLPSVKNAVLYDSVFALELLLSWGELDTGISKTVIMTKRLHWIDSCSWAAPNQDLYVSPLQICVFICSSYSAAVYSLLVVEKLSGKWSWSELDWRRNGENKSRWRWTTKNISTASRKHLLEMLTLSVWRCSNLPLCLAVWKTTLKDVSLSLSLSLCSCGHRKTREMRVRPAMERTRAHFTVNPSPHSSSSSSSSFYLSSSFFSTSSSSYT